MARADVLVGKLNGAHIGPAENETGVERELPRQQVSAGDADVDAGRQCDRSFFSLGHLFERIFGTNEGKIAEDGESVNI